MHVLSEALDYSQTYIDIYDLGIYGNQMYKVCTITQDKLV